MLHNHHKFSIVGLLEPFQNIRHINMYKKRLNMPFATVILNDKILFFENNRINATVAKSLDQHHDVSQSANLIYFICNIGL